MQFFSASSLHNFLCTEDYRLVEGVRKLSYFGKKREKKKEREKKEREKNEEEKNPNVGLEHATLYSIAHATNAVLLSYCLRVELDIP